MRTYAAILTVAILGFTMPAAAHHAVGGEYDPNKPVKLTGTVTKIDWVNPHAFVYLDSKDDSGATRSFRIEMGPPYALQRSGWKKDTLKVGDKITIENAALAKDGSNTAGSLPATSMTLASGQKMVMR